MNINDNFIIIVLQAGAMSMAPRQKLNRFTLPPSTAFPAKFDNFTDQLAGVKAAPGKTKKGQYTLSAYPPLFAPKMNTYKIEDCPWKTNALSITDDLSQKNL